MKFRRIKLAMMAFLTAITALAGGALPATATTDSQGKTATTTASPATAEARVRLTTLECTNSEEGNDEVYIKVNGEHRWDAPDDVCGSMPVNLEVKEGDTVTLGEYDPFGDDTLGSETVEGTRGSLVFNNWDTHYVIYYSPA